MHGYDRALTVFSPDGHLFQVEYAAEAVKRGSTVIGIAGNNCCVLAVEKKTNSQLQKPCFSGKIQHLNSEILLAFSGLAADSRVLVEAARLECQSFHLNMDKTPSADYLSRFVSELQQQYTYKGGARPLGVSTLIVSSQQNITPLPADPPDIPITGITLGKLFYTDPSGVFVRCKAAAIGKNSKLAELFLQKKYTTELGVDGAVLLALETIQEVCHPAKEEQVAVDIAVSNAGSLYFLSQDEIDGLSKKLQENSRSLGAM